MTWRVKSAMVLVVLAPAFAGCGEDASGTRDVTRQSPLLTLSDGSAEIGLAAGGTLALWVQLDSGVTTKNDIGSWDARILTWVEGPASTPFFYLVSEQLQNGTMKAGTPSVNRLKEGEYAHSIRSLYSVDSSDARLLVLVSLPGPGPWYVRVGDPGAVAPNQETGWGIPPPAPSFTPPPILPPPDHSAVDFAHGTQGVEITDTRSRPVAGSFTAGELRYSVRHDAGPGLTYLNIRSRHEGTGDYEVHLSTQSEESASGRYASPKPALSQKILRQTGPSSGLEVTFRPALDANTTLQLDMMTVPLPPDVPRFMAAGALPRVAGLGLR